MQQQQYFINLNRVTPIDTEIAVVHATDIDTIENQVTYVLRGASLLTATSQQTAASLISLDANTGRMTLKRSLESIADQSIQYTIGAVDGGHLESIDNATVSFAILDDANMVPTFERDVYEFNVVEDGAQIGQSVLGTVSATDFDASPVRFVEQRSFSIF
jgi:hypothetical protein